MLLLLAQSGIVIITMLAQNEVLLIKYFGVKMQVVFLLFGDT